MICGIFAILLAVVGRLDLAPLAILLGALFDFFDGFAARLLNVKSEMGKQLDSLADMVTFGVAPGVIMFVMLTMDVNTFVESGHSEIVHYDFALHVGAMLNGSGNDFTPLVALVIPFFALLRLAKFNVDTRQSDRFIGVPTPANTLFLMTFPLMISYPQATPQFVLDNLDSVYSQWSLCILVVGMSVMQVVEIPLFALKFKNFSFQENKVKYLFLLISIGLIILLKTLSVAIIVFLYVLISIVQNVTNKKSKNEIQS